MNLEIFQAPLDHETAGIDYHFYTAKNRDNTA